MSGMKDLIETLFIVLIIATLIQLAFYWLVYGRLAFYKRKENNQESKPVSVIICARNESIRLRKYLPFILEQEYPSYEVIVVNDCSWDETDQVLQEFLKKYSHLKIVTIKEQEKYSHGKKFALTLGIKAASNELLLLTDADCYPAGKKWLTTMQRNFSAEKEIILGYGAYVKEKGMINKLIRFDTFHIAMQYLSMAIVGNAYMGVGRNLAYTKSLFFRNKGFAKHNHILSGDDDLFINENSTKWNTTIEIDPEAFTFSEPKKTFSAWITQKKRHLSTSKYYKFSHKASLAAQSSSTFVFYSLMIVLLILHFEWRILVSLYLINLLLRFPIIYMISKKLKEKDLAWAFPVLDIIHSFLQPVFFTANLLTKQKTWK
jgi:glycosyltransferase involved in cell wall biosynthesis